MPKIFKNVETRGVIDVIPVVLVLFFVTIRKSHESGSHLGINLTHSLHEHNLRFTTVANQASDRPVPVASEANGGSHSRLRLKYKFGQASLKSACLLIVSCAPAPRAGAETTSNNALAVDG